MQRRMNVARSTQRWAVVQVAWVLSCSLHSAPAGQRLAFADRFVSLTFPPLPVLSSRPPAPAAGLRSTPTDPAAIAALTIFAVQSLHGTDTTAEHARILLGMSALPRAPGWLRAACVAGACMSCGEHADSAVARSTCLHSAYVADAFLRCGHNKCCHAIRTVYSGATLQSMHVPIPSHPPCQPSKAQQQLLSRVRQQLAVQEQGYEVSLVACSSGKRDVAANAIPIVLSATDACTLHAQISLMRVGDSVLLPLRPSMPHRLMLLSMLQFPKPSSAGSAQPCMAQPLQGWQLRAEAARGPGRDTGAVADLQPQHSGESSTTPPGCAAGPMRIALSMAGLQGPAPVAATVNVGFVPDVGSAPLVARAVQSLWDLHDRKNMPHLQPAEYKGLHVHAWPCCKKLRLNPGDERAWSFGTDEPVPESWRESLAGASLAGRTVFAFACVDLE